MESENTAIRIAEDLASACHGCGCPLAERGQACPIASPCASVTAEDWLTIFRQAPRIEDPKVSAILTRGA